MEKDENRTNRIDTMRTDTNHMVQKCIKKNR